MVVTPPGKLPESHLTPVVSVIAASVVIPKLRRSPFRRPGAGRDPPISRSIVGHVDAGRSSSSGRPPAGPVGRH